MKKCIIALFGASIGLAGCGTSLEDLFGGGDPKPGQAELRKFTSEDELREYLEAQSRETFRFDFNSPLPIPSPGNGGEMAVDDADGGLSAPEAPGQDGGVPTREEGDLGYSTTTEQEEGVQEADVIKNDGEYLYVLSRGVLRIVKATPAEEMTEVASVELEGYGVDLYLVGDRLVTITAPEAPLFLDDVFIAEAQILPIYPYRPQVQVTVIDAAEKASPTITTRATLDGSISTSRMIGDRLHLVVVNYLESVRGAMVDGDEEMSLDDILPDASIEADGEIVFEGNIADFGDHYRPLNPDGLGMTTILSMDLDAPRDYQAKTVVAYPSNVYASTEALYMTDTEFSIEGSRRENTSIYKFALTDAGPTLTGAGSVPGRVLNQYSMSEYEGFLRVATTVDQRFGIGGQVAASSNNVFVLEPQAERLEIVGRLEGLAPGESIYSARFLGEKGFLVTFRQIDPLFTIDLSDPRNPRMVGELKVPGFSTFITPMGPDHLLTVGRNVNEEFGFADGIRLSIFDVSDFANPQLAYAEIIGEEGAYSDALYNPKAFTYFAEEDLVALPVEIFGYSILPEIDVDVVVEPGTGDGVSTPSSGSGGDAVPPDDGGKDDGGDGNDSSAPSDDAAGSEYFQGLYVYRATPDAGFTLLGRVSTVDDDAGAFFWGPEFTRGAFIGSTVYVVTSEGVQASSMDALDSVIATVEFPVPDFQPPIVPLPEPGPGPGPDPRPTPADAAE